MQVHSRVKYSGSYLGYISFKIGLHTYFRGWILHGFPQYLHEIAGKILKLEHECFLPHVSYLIIGGPVTQSHIASFTTSFFLIIYKVQCHVIDLLLYVRDLHNEVRFEVSTGMITNITVF